MLLVGVLLLGGSLAAAPVRAAAEPTRDVEFVIPDDRIAQSSGLATDPANGVYWTINDSDSSGIVYALNKAGKTVGTLRYDAEPRDVESIAYSGGKLYVGDTGGNRERRTTVTVYEFAAPRPDNSAQAYRTLQFSYPDGPHDTEAMLVDGKGRFTFVTKGAEGGVIFSAPAKLSSAEPNMLTRVGDAPPYVTDGTVLADGRLILRSYVAVFRLDPTSNEIVASAATPPLKQGESVTAPLSGRGLLIGSEGQRSEVLRVPVPSSLGRVPEITPPSSASANRPTPTSSPQPAPAEPAGSLLPLIGGGALAVAAAAGVLIALRRRGRKN